MIKARALRWLAVPVLMLLVLCAGLAAAGGQGAAAQGARPTRTALAQVRQPRIMSINLCADLMMLTLLPRDRIYSISYLAHDRVEQLMPGADAGIPVNHGSAEDIAALDPDIILTGSFVPPVISRIAAMRGIRLVQVPEANDFAAVRALTLATGEALGAQGRAQALVRAMDAKLAWLAEHPVQKRPGIIVWSGDGGTPGAGTMSDAIINAAGGRNMGRELGSGPFVTFGIEELLMLNPDLILQSRTRWPGQSLHERLEDHPVVKRMWQGRRVAFRDPAWGCGLPQSADAAVALRRAFTGAGH